MQPAEWPPVRSPEEGNGNDKKHQSARLVFGQNAGSRLAVKMDLETGGVVGSCMGWECWIPKSVIMEEVTQ